MPMVMPVLPPLLSRTSPVIVCRGGTGVSAKASQNEVDRATVEFARIASVTAQHVAGGNASGVARNDESSRMSPNSRLSASAKSDAVGVAPLGVAAAKSVHLAPSNGGGCLACWHDPPELQWRFVLPPFAPD
jgi:hypothetical protein